jgi:hypothetical protein
MPGLERISRKLGNIAQDLGGPWEIVGVRGGKSLVLTNAHVAGTRPGATGRVWFPFAGNQPLPARIIMAAYSDRVMMDWAVLELEQEIILPHIKLSNTMPAGESYTAGYPRCQGPRYQRLVTRQITHSGTVWRWQPNAIGGQSGSGVHSLSDNLQRGLLTWSWGGDGAGQTTRSIWLQYSTRGEVGFVRPPDLIELAEPNPELETGFFAESNITTLPIWHELSPGPHPDPNEPEPDPNDPACQAFAAQVARSANTIAEEAMLLAELAKRYGKKPDNDGGGNEGPGEGPGCGSGPIFGL